MRGSIKLRQGEKKGVKWLKRGCWTSDLIKRSKEKLSLHQVLNLRVWCKCPKSSKENSPPLKITKRTDEIMSTVWRNSNTNLPSKVTTSVPRLFFKGQEQWPFSKAFLTLSQSVRKFNFHISRLTSLWEECGFDPWDQKIPWQRAWQPTPRFLPG